MICVDTNILIYAHRKDTAHHEIAFQKLKLVAESERPWAISIFSLAEFIRVVSHPRYLANPSSLEDAFDFLDSLLKSPSLNVLKPGEDFSKIFRSLAIDADAKGNLIFDAQIVATMIENGWKQILSEDRDLQRFSLIKRIGLNARLSP